MIRPCVRLVAIVVIVFLGGASHAVPQTAWAAPTQQSAARVLCVNVQGGATGMPCANGEAYTSIQAAVDAATSGDEIRIAQGVYTENANTEPDSNVVTISGKALTLTGGFSPNNWSTPGPASDTVIDGEDQRRGIKIQNTNLDIAHLTITRGRAPREKDGWSEGGGIYADVTIDHMLSLVDVVLTDNVAWNDGGAIFAPEATIVMSQTLVRNSEASIGGGLYFKEGTLTLSNSMIERNIADSFGGGIFGIGAQVHMIGSTISNNSAYNGGGGGLYVSDLDAVDSVIVRNQADGFGGGVFTLTSRFERVLIEDNIAKDGPGGGLDLGESGTIINSLIVNNAANGHGGGLHSYAAGTIDVIGTMFGNNRASIAGDSVFIDNYEDRPTTVKLRNVTISSAERAPHAAIQIEGASASLSLVNTAIANHSVGVARSAGSTLQGNFNAFFGNGTNQTVGGAPQPLPFANVVTADPQFVAPAEDDFHLKEISPLIDAGDPNHGYDDQRDIDGEVVPYGSRADIGADEWAPVFPSFLPQATR